MLRHSEADFQIGIRYFPEAAYSAASLLFLRSPSFTTDFNQFDWNCKI